MLGFPHVHVDRERVSLVPPPHATSAAGVKYLRFGSWPMSRLVAFPLHQCHVKPQSPAVLHSRHESPSRE